MRSPQMQYSLSRRRSHEGEYNEKGLSKDLSNGYQNTSGDFPSKTRTSCIPQPRASLSSFAAPSWNNGTAGEHESQIRVVARIRPMKNNQEEEVISAIHNKDDDVNTNEKKESSPMFRSPPPGSTISEGVADIAARFNTNPGSPLTPNLPNIVTTPTKFVTNHNSPSRKSSITGLSTLQTPIHANADNKVTRQRGTNSILSSSSLRQSFIHQPSSPSLSANSSSKFSFNQTKRTTQQTVSVGLQNPKQFDFDAVLDSSCSQEDVYNQTIGDAVRLNIFRGFNTTVISYGQSKSGKTHSMYGTSTECSSNSMISTSPNKKPSLISEDSPEAFISEEDGIVFRAIHDLFMAKKRHATGGEVVINGTFIEIYNDRIIDLFGHKKSSNSSISTVSSKGLRSIRLKSPSHARHVLHNALRRKSKSRSHTVCTLNVVINPAVNRNITSGKLSYITSTDIVNAKLTLVDLAGSDRSSNKDCDTSRTPQKERNETSIIHKDLFVLSKCITALSEKFEKGAKSVHIPFRDSKLTSILRGSLGGNCCTVMVACVSPGEGDLEVSLNTLKYAERTRNITNRVKKNLIKTSALSPAEGAALRRENKMLRSQLVDVTKKYQLLRRGRRFSDPTSSVGGDDADSVVVYQESFDLSPCNSMSGQQLTPSQQSDLLESQRWRMKYEKLEKICIEAGLSTADAKLSVKDEALLVSQRVEVQELREQIQQLMHARVSDDVVSIGSGFTIDTCDSADDCSIASGSTILSSYASRSTKSTEYIGKTKLMEIEDKKLDKRIQEKKSQLGSMDRDSFTVQSEISILNKKKTKLQSEVDKVEEELHEKETQLADEVKDHEANLNQIDKIVEGLRKQINALKEEKRALEEEMKRLKELLETQKENVKDVEGKRTRIETEISNLKSTVKTLTDEKLSLCDEVEDLQNASNLIIEFSQEQMERQKCEEKLVSKSQEIKALTDERDALKNKINLMKEASKKETEKFKHLQKEMISLKEKISNKISSSSSKKPPILQERTNNRKGSGSALKPPLPSQIHSKPSDLSTISVSNVLNMDDDHSHTSILFGDLNQSTDQDRSVYSCFSETSSLSPEQAAVRMHAQRLLFWANKSIARRAENDDSHVDLSFDSVSEINSIASFSSSMNNNKENGNYCGKPVCLQTQERSPSRRQRARSRSRSRSPGSFIVRHKKGCICHGSIFSGNEEHTEFFLPRLGMACSCGAAEKVTQAMKDNPTALKSFLRAWQVSFLKSIGVTTAKSLIQNEKRDSANMAKAMKKWRHKKRMKPAKTNSCLVALQIWSKVTKTVIQSEAKKARKERAAFEALSCPKFVEFNGGRKNKSRPSAGAVEEDEEDDEFDDDFHENGSFASVSTLGNNISLEIDGHDNISLMDGEFEI